MPSPIVLLPLILFLHVPPPATEREPSDCASVAECRALALEAAERGEHERFHDLAWRTQQVARKPDPETMYLLARAQSLSGRPLDALVTLRRLAEMGVPTDAASSDDFRRVRALPGWADVEALAAKLDPESRIVAAPVDPAVPPEAAAPRPPEDSPAPAAPAPPPARSPAAKPLAVTPAATVTEAARFTATAFLPGGLAYDAVSKRFVIGSRDQQKLLVVGEGAPQAVTLVGAGGRLLDVTALEIDRRRGDLWVVSVSPANGGAPAEPGAVLHKLQLISGRVLSTYPAPGDAPARFTDVALLGDGTVLVLDGLGRRVFRLAPGSAGLVPAADLPSDLPAAVSFAPGGTPAVVYVAAEDGLLRVNLETRATARLGGVELPDLERIRYHRGSLVGVQRRADGTRVVLRARLDAAGRSVTAVESLDDRIPAGPPVAASLLGGDFYYLVPAADGQDAVIRRAMLK